MEEAEAEIEASRFTNKYLKFIILFSFNLKLVLLYIELMFLKFKQRSSPQPVVHESLVKIFMWAVKNGVIMK